MNFCSKTILQYMKVNVFLLWILDKQKSRENKKKFVAATAGCWRRTLGASDFLEQTKKLKGQNLLQQTASEVGVGFWCTLKNTGKIQETRKNFSNKRKTSRKAIRRNLLLKTNPRGVCLLGKKFPEGRRPVSVGAPEINKLQ